MVVSSHAVAAALRDRIPGVATKKLHKLLYYCQGHHLAAFEERVFSDSISAWDMGPVVGRLWFEEKQGLAASQEVSNQLTEAQLNTIGYVVSRYGGLTGRDLEVLTHHEGPWQRADADRNPGESVLIKVDWILDWFRSAREDEDDQVGLLESSEIASWLDGAENRLKEELATDDVDALRRRIANAG